MPVTSGITYTFLVGVDERVSDIDLYVSDEQGNEILADDRRDKRAGTKFLATYTGTAEVFIFMNNILMNRKTGKFHNLASWSLLVGTRGGSGQERKPPAGTPDNNNQKARDAVPEAKGGI
jgi:hypothetical protein